eukprot:8199811-Alexandrium_andersonii.AAC.1
MSASLVGSEMCIRDSDSPDVELGILKAARTSFPPGKPKALQNRGVQPVSYTHLTLPTICSV